MRIGASGSVVAETANAPGVRTGGQAEVRITRPDLFAAASDDVGVGVGRHRNSPLWCYDTVALAGA